MSWQVTWWLVHSTMVHSSRSCPISKKKLILRAYEQSFKIMCLVLKNSIYLLRAARARKAKCSAHHVNSYEKGKVQRAPFQNTCEKCKVQESAHHANTCEKGKVHAGAHHINTSTDVPIHEPFGHVMSWQVMWWPIHSTMVHSSRSCPISKKNWSWKLMNRASKWCA